MIILGDSFEEVKKLESNSIDSLVTDPPYGMSNISHAAFMECMIQWCKDDDMYLPKAKGFMNKSWDGFVPPPRFWKEVLRVLKPGSYGLVFASSRTMDLMGLALRIAGFEIRDCITWLYGEGFPKSHDISKALDKINSEKSKKYNGYGTALKPSYEPALLIRKPMKKSVAENVLHWGVGGLNIDGCRIDSNDSLARINSFKDYGFMNQGTVGKGKSNQALRIEQGLEEQGRFPSNTLFDSEAAKGLKENSRFFYTAKASKAERSAGLEGLNIHPTVKPIEIMRYLSRLITPPNGIILEPFLGSGTTAIAAGKEGFRIIGIEREKEYYDIALKRIEYWKTHNHAMTEQNPVNNDQLDLFG
jgi:site-specific DNA-methyltransferase (adenine-specific)